MTDPIPRPIVEVAVDSLAAAESAWSLGADRIELCQALEVGGLTPSRGMMVAAVQGAAGPVFALIRSRPGEFGLDPGELELGLRDIETAGSAGCAGVVIGPLLPGHQVATAAVGAMVSAAGGMSVTFHRAFDLCPDPIAALEQLIDLGVARILTSGGAATAYQGREALARLTARAGARLTVIGGGGVTADHAVDLVRATKLREIHLAGSTQTATDRAGGFGMNTMPNPARVSGLLAALAAGFGPRLRA